MPPPNEEGFCRLPNWRTKEDYTNAHSFVWVLGCGNAEKMVSVQACKVLRISKVNVETLNVEMGN